MITLFMINPVLAGLIIGISERCHIPISHAHYYGISAETATTYTIAAVIDEQDKFVHYQCSPVGKGACIIKTEEVYEAGQIVPKESSIRVVSYGTFTDVILGH
jgi:hypothetical protein